MKSKFIILIVVIVYILHSCKSINTQGDGSVVEVMVGSNKVNVVLLNKVKSEIKTIPLSSLVEDFEIVQLEMHDDAVFHISSYITITENYIGVRPISERYILFDRSGKFICAVGRRGGGPGEYQSFLSDDIIDEKNGLIYLAPFFSNKILVYNTSGQFVNEFVAPQQMRDSQIFLSNDILTVVHTPRIIIRSNETINEADAMITQFDVNTGEVLKRFTPPAEHFILRQNGSDILSSRNTQGVFDFVPDYYTTSQYDTLYNVDVKTGEIIPVFTMDFYLTIARDKPIFFQLNKSLFMSTLKKTQPAGYYVETDLIATDLNSKTSARVMIVNDYFGNMDALPNSFHKRFKNGYYVYHIQPEDLIENIEKRLSERNITETDRDVLTNKLSTLKEGTNNVVFIGKIRDEIETKLW